MIYELKFEPYSATAIEDAWPGYRMLMCTGWKTTDNRFVQGQTPSLIALDRHGFFDPAKADFNLAQAVFANKIVNRFSHRHRLSFRCCEPHWPGKYILRRYTVIVKILPKYFIGHDNLD